MISRKYVSVRQLKSGMQIDQSIIDNTGRLLVVRKTVLDDQIIQSLINMNVAGVYVCFGEEEDIQGDVNEVSDVAKRQIEKFETPDRSKMELSKAVKERVASGVSLLFRNPDSQDLLPTVNNISGELMKAINENDAIAVDISALEVSDEYTFKHSVDVASIAMIVAKQNNLSDREIYQIGVAGLLHDLGKARIPGEILNKPARLTKQEFDEMKKHPVYGYDILKNNKEIAPEILLGVLQHHEKINGSGYPFGLSAKQISPYSQILSVADIYDALVTERPYKDKLTQRDAVETLMAMTRELDLGVIRLLMRSVILYPVGSRVRLSNGEMGHVLENYPDRPTRPKIVGLRSGRIYDLAEDINCASIIVD